LKAGQERKNFWFGHFQVTFGLLERRMSPPQSDCPIEGAMVLLSGRWRALILYYLDQGPKRFNALRRELGPISQQMLTRELRALEEAGAVSRSIYAEVPPRVEYALTGWGRELMPIIEALGSWWESNEVRTGHRTALEAAVPAG
jgi:DNA-binding HxlR family transcriptional regulator